MDFFKYIGGILDKFTAKQRITVLAILLFSGAVMLLGPSLIDNLSYDRQELLSSLSAKRNEVLNLQSSVDSLNSVIRNNQRKCTNEIAQREVEFNEIIDKMRRSSETLSRKLVYNSIERFPGRDSSLIMLDLRSSEIPLDSIALDSSILVPDIKTEGQIPEPEKNLLVQPKNKTILGKIMDRVLGSTHRTYPEPLP